jgi:serine/threonine-protein kinase HipA
MSLLAASVWLYDQRVGELRQDERGYIEFHPAQTWFQRKERPVLGQWFEERPGRCQRGARPGDLPPFFANLIPESDLGLLLRERLGIAPDDDLGLLIAVGEDLPGAVVVRAESEDGAAPRSIPERPAATHGSDQPRLRFSLAGVQLKFSMLRAENRFYFPGNDQRGDWIAKIARDDYAGLCENEHVTMEWARLAGFDVPPCELRRLGDLVDVPHEGDPEAAVYVIRRYDREGARRIHQEDMMQVLGYPNWPSTRKYNDATYEQLALIVSRVVGPAAFDEMLRRLVFVVASGNNDAHLKNWSILYPDGIAAALTPLYDQTFAGQWPTLDRELALNLGGAKPFAAIEMGRFRELARRAAQDPERAAQLASLTIEQIADAWTALRREITVPEAYLEPMRRHWAAVPVLAPHALLIT